MITKSSPSEIEWITGPLPNPNLVHPDCRIIIWYNIVQDGSPEIRILQSEKCWYSWEGPDAYIRFRWVDNKNYIWDYENNKIQCWGWWKHFR